MKNNTKVKAPKKKGRAGKVFLIIFLCLIAGFALLITQIQNNGSTGSEDAGGNIDFNSSKWVGNAQTADKEYLNQHYNSGQALSYHLADERAWFVDYEYDYGQDDTYTSDDHVFGYYVCEGSFDYDIPSDGKTDPYKVNYSATVFVTDNANDYRWSWRTMTITYDGTEIDSIRNGKFFTE